MGYSLGQAARAAGVSKTSIGRAIASGRLSAAKNEAGGYDIDPAELSRVYPVIGNGDGHLERSVTPERIDSALVELRGERDRYQSLAEERERTIARQDETIRDLRTRLDREVDERRQLIALLTDERRRPWWRRWFR